MSRIKLIDFENISNNDFAVVDELPFCITKGTEEGSFRPDITILINGIPLGFLEVKKPNNNGGIQKEFKKFFNMLQMVSFSNNMEYEEEYDAEDVKAGSFYTTPNGTNTILKSKEIIVENQQLASFRDWLLPMLMNGQVGFEGVE